MRWKAVRSCGYFSGIPFLLTAKKWVSRLAAGLGMAIALEIVLMAYLLTIKANPKFR
jgi:hypothetical protein